MKLNYFDQPDITDTVTKVMIPYLWKHFIKIRYNFCTESANTNL